MPNPTVIDEAWLDRFRVSSWIGEPLVRHSLIGKDAPLVLSSLCDQGDYYRFAWVAVRAMPWEIRLHVSIGIAKWTLPPFEKIYPDDPRPRQAIDEALLVQREPSVAHMISASLAIEPARIAAFAAANDMRWDDRIRLSLVAEVAAGAARTASSSEEGRSINATFETLMDAAGAAFSDHRKTQNQIMEYLLPQVI